MRRLLIAIAAIAIALLDVQPAAALTRTTATWTHMNDGPFLYWQATAFVPTTCRLVTFGGGNGGSIVSSTSFFDPVGNTWTTIAGRRTGPAAQSLGAMAWDPQLQRVVLFGGRTNRGPIQETWAFDPSARTWAPLVTRCRTGNCPAARFAHGMVWSTRINKLVMFGGSAGGSLDVLLDDLWTYNGTWTKVAVSGARPSPRFLFGMAEDASTGKIVLYGGATVEMINGIMTYHGLNDTWILDPATMAWSKIATPATPTSFGEVAMGWSPSIGGIVLTGGSDWMGITVPNPGTWAFDMTTRTWVKLTTNVGPSPRKNAAFVTDTCHGSAILFAGADSIVPLSFTDRTWILR